MSQVSNSRKVIPVIPSSSDTCSRLLSKYGKKEALLIVSGYIQSNNGNAAAESFWKSVYDALVPCAEEAA